MKTKVKVTAVDGKVIILSANNPEFGYIRVEQTVTKFNDQGFVNKSNMSALVKGKIADLTSFGWKEGQLLDGKLVVRESTIEPFEGAQPKINPSTSEVIMHNGSPVYRDTIYDPTGSKEDILLQTTGAGVVVAETTKAAN